MVADKTRDDSEIKIRLRKVPLSRSFGQQPGSSSVLVVPGGRQRSPYVKEQRACVVRHKDQIT